MDFANSKLGTNYNNKLAECRMKRLHSVKCGSTKLSILLVQLICIILFTMTAQAHLNQRISSGVGEQIEPEAEMRPALSTRQTSNSKQSQSIKVDELNSEESNEQQIARLSQNEPPRQYFKVHVSKSGPGSAKTRVIKEANARHKQGASSSFSIKSIDHTGSPKTNQTTKSTKSISNATLKRLLSQSLSAQNRNGSSSVSSASGKASGSNFKLMFIQRATAKPAPSQRSGETSGEVKGQAAGTGKPAATATGASNPPAPSSGAEATDILKKVAATAAATIIGSQEKKKTTTTTSQVNKPKQPSKIYNLPVKFVSNGQPNHVVLSTIRKHFATIKKLQIERQKLAGNGSGDVKGQQRRKQFQHNKLKGTNSKLIYLPLKYLSNAKPNGVLIGGKTATS